MGLLRGAGPDLLSSEQSEVEDRRLWMSGTCCEETEMLKRRVHPGLGS